MELREALTGIYIGPLMTDQVPEVWKVLCDIILTRAMRQSKQLWASELNIIYRKTLGKVCKGDKWTSIW